MKLRQYAFTSHWYIHHPVRDIEAVLEDIEGWVNWWPELTSAQLNHKRVALGSQLGLTWRAPFGYQLRHTITVQEHVPGVRIVFSSTGDLLGTGAWEFQSAGENTEVLIDWHVRTTKPWMNFLGVVLKPLFKLAHRKVMHDGERGLNQHITRT